MVSQQERTRLIEAYKYEPVAGAPVILRYATGLLFVVGLVVFAPGTESLADDASGNVPAAPHSARY